MKKLTAFLLIASTALVFAAGELTISLSGFHFTKGSQNIYVRPGLQTINVTGTHSASDVGTATTTDATVSKGAIGTIGWVYIENDDLSNNLLIGGDGTTYPFMLKPNEKVAFRFNATNMHVKSSVATVAYYYAMIED